MTKLIDFGSNNTESIETRKTVKTNEAVSKVDKNLLATKKVGAADKALSTSKAGRVKNDKYSKEDGFNPDAPVNPAVILGSRVVEEVSVEQLKQVYPIRVTPEVLNQCADIINSMSKDMDFVIGKQFRDNCLTYIDCIKGERRGSTFEDYANAVKFATFKFAGNTDIRAYSLTFPDRVQRMADEGLPTSYLYSYSQSFARNKCVVDVMAKMIVPTHIMYQDIFHQAVKTQAEIMMDNSVSPKVRSDAANSLMTHLKTPEIKQTEIKIDTNNNGAITQLAEALNAISGKQRDLILAGEYSIKDVSEAEIYTENTLDGQSR